MIEFNQNQGAWCWNIEHIEQQKMTDNVVDLMIGKLQKLAKDTQNLLKLAACIGNQFDLKTLSIVHQKSPWDCANDLWPALQSGFILPIDESYKFLLEDPKNPKISYRFLHDRVQQAAYTLIKSSQLKALHLNIGLLLLNDTPRKALDKHIFDIVSHMNLGKALLTTHQEKIQLASLNLQAGNKARKSTAYQTAALHFTIGRNLLPKNAWDSHYELTFQLHRGLAEAQYLSGNFQQAEAIYPIAIQHANSTLDEVDIYTIQATQYQLQARYQEAIEVQRAGLAILNVTIPKQNTESESLFNQGLQDVELNLNGRAIEDLIHTQVMDNPEQLAAMKLLSAMWYSAYLSGQWTLNSLMTLNIINLSLKHGNSEISAFGYVNFAFLLGWVLGDFKKGYQYGKMGMKLSGSFDSLIMRCNAQFLYTIFTHHMNHHQRTSDPLYDECLTWGIETGDFVTSGYIIALRTTDRLNYGQNLIELHKFCQRDVLFLQGTKQPDMLACTLSGALQPIRSLMGLTKDPKNFDDETFSESSFLETYGHSITQKIMDYTKISKKSDEDERVNIDTLIEKIIQSHSESFKEQKITTCLTLAKQNTQLLGDEEYFHVILNNLILNARDALLDPKNTKTDPHRIHITTATTDHHYSIQIRDNGIGIPAENISKIYEAFFSTKPKTGMGLGMGFVQKIISRYAGTIQVESEVGIGTIFTLDFPIKR